MVLLFCHFTSKQIIAVTIIAKRFKPNWLTQSRFIWRTNCFFIAPRNKRSYSHWWCVRMIFLHGRRFITLCAVTCIVKIIYYPCETYKQDCIIVTLIGALRDNAKRNIEFYLQMFTHMANERNSHAEYAHTHTHTQFALKRWRNEDRQRQYRAAWRGERSNESILILFVIPIQFGVHFLSLRSTDNVGNAKQQQQ